MNKSQRIHFESGNTNDNNVKVQLMQDVDTIEFLSMSVSTKDVYRDFNADYGVLIGRVTANGGVGIPNAKISIFIPLSDTDAEDSEISSIYPYKTPRDKNIDGKRYNLLPRVAKVDTTTGVAAPKQPFGSFPIKEETIINDSFLKIYKKYYKYTALTNSSGDYMIFGVPIGTQTVHMSVDITDIGKYSMTPAAMVTNLGYSPNLFTDGNSKIKPSNDLNDLPNIETQEISVDIVPFWGDTENFEIGITRQDFRIRSVLVNTFIIFGSVFTDGSNSMWGEDFAGGLEIREMYRIRNVGLTNIGIKSKRVGKVTEKIYAYPTNITDAQIPTANPQTDMVLLDPTEYSSYKRDGDFVFILNCNRRKIITDEFGGEIVVSDTSPNGIFTQFKGFMTLEITPDDVPMNFIGWLNGSDRGELIPFRYKLKFPQSAAKGHSFRNETDTTSTTDTQAWRKQYYTFSGGNLYSVAKFHGIVYNNVGGEGDQSTVDGFLSGDYVNFGKNYDQFWNTGVIQTNDYGITGNTMYEMIGNTSNGSLELFAANWLNLSVHLIQTGYLAHDYSRVRNMRSNSNFSQNFKSSYYMNDNTQAIAGGDFNTKWFARSDLHYTDFIYVPKQDVIKMNQYLGKGFTKGIVSGLTGTYRNGQTPCPVNGGKVEAVPANPEETKTYFYKGFDTANCVEYLTLLGII